MKLISIALENFRQFKGKQVFPLGGDPGKPVTLIFGANGAGKTTLLNAFIWALYGKLTDDVEVRERLITDVVWRSVTAGEAISVGVDVEFEHDGASYRVRRSATVRKEADDQPVLSGDVEAWLINPAGESERISTPQPTIDSILPPRMSRFFFFNGERIEKLTQKGAYADVRNDVRALLGLTQVERAVGHLKKADRKLGSALRKYGDEKVVETQEKIERLEDERDRAVVRLAALRGELAHFEAEAAGTRDLLRQHEAARPLQEERERVSADLLRTRLDREKALQDKRNLLATKGFLAFVGPTAERTAAVAKSLYEKGALPAPLKRDFVESLLTNAQCICGTSLAEGSDAWAHVHEWRLKAGLAEVEAAWQKLEGSLGDLAGTRTALRGEVTQALDLIESQGAKVIDLEERLQDLQLKLENVPLEEVKNLNAKLQDLQLKLENVPLEEVKNLNAKLLGLEGEIAKVNRKIGVDELAVNESKNALASAQAELEKAEVSDKSAALARERMGMVHKVQAALEEIYVIREREMTARVQEEVREIFAKITTRPFIPVLGDGFDLGLYQDVDGELVPVAKSTGENQILSLSFVAAVSSVARKSRGTWHAEQESEAGDWGQYPIVMDAAFGSLDQNYQRDVSQALAKMSPQLVVLVSKSQGLGHVLTELRPYTSNIGVIVTHSTNKDRTSEEIDILGTSLPYVQNGASQDWAELKVVN